MSTEIKRLEFELEKARNSGAPGATPATTAAQKATASIPVVFALVLIYAAFI